MGPDTSSQGPLAAAPQGAAGSEGKTLAVLKYFFTVAGVGMVLGGVLWYHSTSTFLHDAVRARGTVVDLLRSRSGDSTVYRPVLTFTTERGETIRFVSSSGSRPPGYSKGEEVAIWYRPAEPQNASVDGFFSLWGGALILGGLGSVFLLIGAALHFVRVLEDGGSDERHRRSRSLGPGRTLPDPAVGSAPRGGSRNWGRKRNT